MAIKTENTEDASLLYSLFFRFTGNTRQTVAYLRLTGYLFANLRLSLSDREADSFSTRGYDTPL